MLNECGLSHSKLSCSLGRKMEGQRNQETLDFWKVMELAKRHIGRTIKVIAVNVYELTPCVFSADFTLFSPIPFWL